MAETRLCMIGAGGHASRNVYPNFHVLAGARVVANCDLVEERARRLASLFGIPRTYTDYREMLDTEKPDGVVICVDRFFHAKAAAELMEMGFHVYTEKPNADSLGESKRVLEVQRRTSLVCMVAYKKRFAPSYRKAKEIIESDEFGRPSLLTVYRTKGHDPAKDDPHDPYLLRWGCHAIDLMPFLFGPVERVQVFTAHGTTRSYVVNVSFASGAVGNLSISNRAGGDVIEEVSAVGGGRVRVTVERSLDMRAWRNGVPFAEHRPEFATGGYQGGIEQGFVGELVEFVDAIRGGREPESSIADATHTMAVYDAILRSAASGETFAVERT